MPPATTPAAPASDARTQDVRATDGTAPAPDPTPGTDNPAGPGDRAASDNPAGPSADRCPDGHRERKKRETRRALRMAALTLVDERGLEGVTVDEIAAAADVSPRTFFNYFAGKEDALVGNDPELVADLGRALSRRPAGEPPLEALRAAFLDVAGAISANRPVWELRMRVVRANPSLRAGLVGATAELDRLLTAVIAERTGTAATDLYPSLVAAVTASAARVAIQHSRLSTGDQGSHLLTEAIDHAFDLLTAGLPTPEP